MLLLHFNPAPGPGAGAGHLCWAGFGFGFGFGDSPMAAVALLPAESPGMAVPPPLAPGALG